jgi:hypothetical protein
MNDGTPAVKGDTAKMVMRASEDDYALSTNGDPQQTDTSADVMGTAISTIRIGKAASAAQVNTPIQRISLIPRGKTNLELETEAGN